MKKTILVLFATMLSSLAGFSQYSIDWFTIDGGGGTSTGGVYAVSGTLGQPDAGQLRGGNYTLEGGFWSVVAAVQSSGAPFLTVQLTATNSVIISWPAASEGWLLQENPMLGTANWANTATPPATNGNWKQVVLPSPIGNRFYRLKK